MKILYVNTMGIWGGVATYLHALIEDQVHRGNKVYLLVGSKGKLTDTIKKELPSVKIILLPTLQRNIHIIDTLRAIFEFRKIVKKIQPDIIHLNCIMSGIVGRLGSVGLSPKIIYNAHGWDFDPRVNKFLRILAIVIEKFLSYLTDKIICVSDYEYNIANKYHIFRNKNQGIVIKNGSSRVYMMPSKRLVDNVIRITMAARFLAPKDQSDLIKSFKILDKQLLPKQHIKLYLLGSGPNLKKCIKLSKNLNVNNDVEFTGEVSNVLQYYNQSDIVTLITKSDAISISLIEALSLGKPLIASNVAGVPEVFDNNGYCVENNIKSIACAFYKLIINPILRHKMGENSKILFNREFVLTKSLNKHNYLYKKILHG